MNKSKIKFGKISRNFSQNSAVIKSSGEFGTLDTPKAIEVCEDDIESQQLHEVMGIDSFGKKKAKDFDIKEMLDQVKATVSEINRNKSENSTSEDAIKQEEQNESSSCAEDTSDDDDGFIGPPVPVLVDTKDSSVMKTSKKQAENNSDEDDSDDEDFETFKLFIPCDSSSNMVHGNKAVTAISLDHSGGRLASGSVDYDVSFWDFAGMDSNMRSFRTLQPMENYPIRALHYSISGDLLLVISGSNHAKVLDRDGFEKLETIKGDVYITDQTQTKGHTAGLLAGAWNPVQKEEFLTTSADGTVRTWLFYQSGKRHKTIFKCRAQNGLKVAPTAVEYNRDGRTVVCGCSDGSIQLWDLRRCAVSPTNQVRKAHQPTEITSIRYSHTGDNLLSRSCDSTMKLWDVRNLKECIHQVGDLFTRYDTTDAIFSPNDAIVVTGESLQKGETTGHINFYETSTFALLKRLPVTDSHTIKIDWHPKLNQIFVGGGNGIITCLYDMRRSLRGATLCAIKVHKRTHHTESTGALQIITPHALPLFRQERRKTRRKQAAKDRLDPVKSRRPDLPITSGQGGRVASSGSTLSSYVIRNLGLSKRIDDDQDPREAILKYAKVAEEDPYWIAPAYAKTQPKPKFSEDTGEQPAEKMAKSE